MMNQAVTNVLSKPTLHIESVYERISERFDGILELLTPNAFVYGGVLRDLAANMPLVGDLDILVPTSEVANLCDNLKKSRNWIDIEVLSNLSQHSLGVGLSLKLKFMTTKYPTSNIAKIITFRNKEGIKVQVISTPIDKLYEFMKTIDIVCCGISMDSHGTVYEVIEGAEAACLSKTLTMNDTAIKDDLNIEVLGERITKLVKRGWTNKINVRQVTSKVNKLKIIKKTTIGLKLYTTTINRVYNGFSIEFDASCYNKLLKAVESGVSILNNAKLICRSIATIVDSVNTTNVFPAEVRFESVSLNVASTIKNGTRIMYMSVVPLDNFGNIYTGAGKFSEKQYPYITEICKRLDEGLLKLLKEEHLYGRLG